MLTQPLTPPELVGWSLKLPAAGPPLARHALNGYGVRGVLQYTMTGDLVESLEFLGMKVTKAWEYNIQQSVTQLWEEGTKKRNPDMFFDAILLFTLSAIVPHVKVRADDPRRLLRLVRRARSRTFATPMCTSSDTDDGGSSQLALSMALWYMPNIAPST